MENTKQIVENNKMIAEFMGAELLAPNSNFGYVKYPNNVSTSTNGQHKETYKQTIHSKNLEYHLEWNWLIPVFEKINSLGFACNIFYGSKKDKNRSTITKLGSDLKPLFETQFTTDFMSSAKESTYNACIEFIKWYNQQKS